MITQQPIKMFVYQPVKLNGRWKCSVKFDRMPYYDKPEVGDIFTLEKRPADYTKLIKQKESTVAAVRFNLCEKACIVILEDMDFDKKEEMDKFLIGKVCMK